MLLLLDCQTTFVPLKMALGNELKKTKPKIQPQEVKL